MDTTLLKGLQVLDHIARADHIVRIAEVATQLNFTKSNAYRVLKTLESAGYVRQDPSTKGFAPTLKLWELGMQVGNRLDLRARAHDILQRLAEASRETVHLSVLDGQDVIYIDKIDSREPVSVYTTLGGRAPAYCVATGKALLSQLPDHELAQILVNLQKHSKFTITDPGVLRADLAKANALGYAINRGEWRDSVWGLASAVRDAAGVVVAAVGVSGPRYRLENEDRCAELAGLVQVAAADISKQLGCRA
jgi:DNA-binding IclR family transcriptional regulator